LLLIDLNCGWHLTVAEIKEMGLIQKDALCFFWIIKENQVGFIR
jgi:hypothetical protein